MFVFFCASILISLTDSIALTPKVTEKDRRFGTSSSLRMGRGSGEHESWGAQAVAARLGDPLPILLHLKSS
jgi:hypothetical protein